MVTTAPVFFVIPRLLYEIFGLHPFGSVYCIPFITSIRGVLEHCDDYMEYLTFGIMTGRKMHFVHHQLSRANYGFYTYLWDWLFGTKVSYEDMLKNVKC